MRYEWFRGSLGMKMSSAILGQCTYSGPENRKEHTVVDVDVEDELSRGTGAAEERMARASIETLAKVFMTAVSWIVTGDIDLQIIGVRGIQQ